MGEAVLVAVRVALAVVFLAAAIAKIRDRSAVERAAEDLGVPEGAGRPVSFALPPVETVVAVVVLLHPVGSLLAVMLLGAFTGLLVGNLRRGNRPPCACFGQAAEKPISWWSVVRNLLLIAAGVAAFAGSEGSVFDWAADELRDGEVLRAAVVALGLAVLVEAAVIVSLIRRPVAAAGGHGEHHHGPAGLEVGTAAPSFTAVDVLDRRRVALDDLLAAGKPVLLVFTDPGCGPCNALMPELGEWQHDAGESVTVAVVASGSEEENRSKATEHGLRVLLQRGSRVAESYRYSGTPGAVLVDAEGGIASETVAGAPAIRELLRRVAGDAVAAPVVGDLAPPIRLAAVDGSDVDLYTEFAGGLTLVVFWSPTCGFCSKMLPDLRRLEDRFAEAGVEVLVVSDGSAVANRRQRLRSTVVLDEEGRPTMSAFGVDGTPSALMLDASLRIASAVAVGAEEVLALAERAITLASAAAALEARGAETQPAETQ